MKFLNKTTGIIVVGIFGLFFCENINADETGPSSCGYAIDIIGSVNHYGNPEGYTVENATDNEMYVEEIYGDNFSTVIRGLPQGLYTIQIYMAESYHNASGKRLFNIFVGENVIGENIDIFNEVGVHTEYLFTKEVNYQPSESITELTIQFNSVQDKAKFNAIHLLNDKDSLVACTMASEFVTAIKPMGTGNPFIQHMYTADPSAHEFEGKIYVYPSHDLNNASGFNMRDYHVFSSSDLSTWEDHGIALDVDDVPWAKEYMWAPDCIYKDGVYYFYFPAKDQDGEFKIGVATSNSPSGPFTPEPEPMEGSFSVDPAVFIDDDGQAYMYFGGAGDGGQSVPGIAKLDDSMKAFSEEPKSIEGTDHWFEACWMNKIDDTYYLSYSTGTFHPDYPERSAIAYATSDNPYGPFQYQGVINAYVSGWTNHHSIMEYKGQSYLFYHNSDLSGGNTVKRSICADYLHFNDNGSIKEVVQTEQGIGSYDGSKKIEAENYSERIGAKKVECNEGNFQVTFNPKDTLVYYNVDFTDNIVNSVQLRIATESDGGSIDLYNSNSELIANVPITNTGSSLNWETISYPLLNTLSGKSNITLVYKGAVGSTLNLNWFKFGESAPTIGQKHNNPHDFKTYPNPVENIVHLEMPKYLTEVNFKLYSISGSLIKTGPLKSNQFSIAEFNKGLYYLMISNYLEEVKYQTVLVKI